MAAACIVTHTSPAPLSLPLLWAAVWRCLRSRAIQAAAAQANGSQSAAHCHTHGRPLRRGQAGRLHTHVACLRPPPRAWRQRSAFLPDRTAGMRYAPMLRLLACCRSSSHGSSAVRMPETLDRLPSPAEATQIQTTSSSSERCCCSCWSAVQPGLPGSAADSRRVLDDAVCRHKEA